jgi:PAS domain S-box-containing protein
MKTDNSNNPIDKAAQKSDEKYHSLFDLNRDSIVIFRIKPDGKPSNFIDVNPASTVIFGYSKKELLAMKVDDLYEISDAIRQKRIEILKTKGRIAIETTIKNKKGFIRNVEIETQLINYLNEPAVMNIIRDITERKDMESNVAKANETLTTILEALPDLLFEVGLDGRIYHYQSHRNDLLAAPPELFMGKMFQKILPADAVKVCFEALHEANEKGWSTGKEYALDLPHGKFWFEISVSPLKKDLNKNPHFILLARDITDRKMAEEALQKSEEKLRGVFDLANSGIMVTNLKGKYLIFNNWCIENFGFSKKELTAMTIIDLTSPDDLKNSNLLFNKLIKGEIEKYQLEKRYIRKDKSSFWAEVSVSAIKDKNNKVVNTIGVVIDITARKKSEQALQNSENFAKATFNALSSQIAVLDENGYLLSVNTAWQNFAEANAPKEAKIKMPIGVNYLTICTNCMGQPCEEAVTIYAGIQSVINREQQEFTLEYPCHSPAEKRWFNVRVTPFLENGDMRIVVAHEDITKTKLAEEDLKISSEKFQTLVDSTGGIVWEADAKNFNFNYVSQEAERLLGYPIEEWKTDGFWANHLHPDEKDQIISFCVSRTKKMEAHDFIYRFKSKKGNYLWLRDIVTVVTENGKPICLRGIMFDISQQKETEESLRESENKYRDLVEHSPDGIVIYADAKIVFVNNEIVRLLEAKNKEELMGKSVLQFVPQEHIADVIQRMENIPKTTQALATIEKQIISVSGNTIDVELKAIPILFDRKPAVQVMIHDITKRKKKALELYKINRVYVFICQINDLIIRTNQRQELFQEICNIAVHFGKFRMSWIGLLAENTNVIQTAAFAGFENDYFKSSIITASANDPGGKGPTGIAVRGGKTVICNDIANDPRMKPWKEEALERGYRSVIAIPIVVRYKIIGSFNLYSNEINFFSSEEEISLLEKIILNLSFALEGILIEEERKSSEVKISQLSQAVEQSPVVIVITNTEGEIEYANPKFVETSGYSLDEVIGKNLHFLKSEYTSPDEYKELWRTQVAEKDWHGEIYNKRKDGTFYWESAKISPILNSQGQTTHYIGIKEDITQRKKTERQLIKAKEKAEESNRLKLAFLANMSHEIRTPMNGILGFTKLLKEPKLTGEEQLEYIKIIEKSGRRMLNIINDIISISKVESGQIEVSLSETDVNEQIEYLNTFFKPETKQKGITLLNSKKLLSMECVISTDKEKIYAILTNLLKNAIKFTDKGSIEFGCERKGETVVFFVKDTGSGIPKAQQKIIFDRFRQANETITRSHEGSGLGLAISKAYVEILGGKIWVKSKVGKGSRFYFTIPFKDGYEAKNNFEKAISSVKTENKIKDLKVLIVEDDSISKLLISIAVKPYSKEILEVSTGLEAVAACRDNPDLDLVLMDINMPKMDGYEATKKIREFNNDLVIIAQTANGMQMDLNNAIAAGCTDYISKPINIDLLNGLIQKYFEK